MNTIKKNFRGDISRYHVNDQWVGSFISRKQKILDLGYSNERNAYADIMRSQGYSVENTNFDLDIDTHRLGDIEYDCVTAFEVFEHLVNPYGVLKELDAGKKLVCSVPLRFCLAKPYWNKNDKLRRHYHEFLQREFEMLLEKAGYEIECMQQECIVKNFGIRQILTWIFNVKRYLFVVAKKK
jgi:hypothetical protein